MIQFLNTLLYLSIVLLVLAAARKLRVLYLFFLSLSDSEYVVFKWKTKKVIMSLFPSFLSLPSSPSVLSSNLTFSGQLLATVCVNEVLVIHRETGTHRALYREKEEITCVRFVEWKHNGANTMIRYDSLYCRR